MLIILGELNGFWKVLFFWSQIIWTSKFNPWHKVVRDDIIGPFSMFWTFKMQWIRISEWSSGLNLLLTYIYLIPPPSCKHICNRNWNFEWSECNKSHDKKMCSTQSSLTSVVDDWARLILIFWRLWVQIPALYTGWTFVHIFVVKIVMFETRNINGEEAVVGLIKKIGVDQLVLQSWKYSRTWRRMI